VITLADCFYCGKTAREATSFAFTAGIGPYSVIKKKDEGVYQGFVKTVYGRRMPGRK
jgi:hypothetical protein